jgi:hypothetical protein
MIELLPSRLENELGRLISPREKVFVKLRGTFSEGLVCTSTRVIILKSGFMTGQLFGINTFQLPYAHVAGVQVRFNLLTGYFELSAAGMQSSDKDFWNRDKKFSPAKAPNCVSIAGLNRANSFRRACTFILQHRAQGGDAIAAPGDQLAEFERLSNLRASGAISDAEFAALKKRLIDSL